MTSHHPASPPDLKAVIDTYLSKLPQANGMLAADPPYPVDAFPPVVAGWLRDVSTMTRVPLSLTATPFLACTGATIGRQLRLEVGPGWYERPALWVALITLTGIGKTPAISAIRQPFDLLQQEAWDTWRGELAEWQAAPEPRGQRPGFNRLVTAGASIHALTAALQDSTGLLILRDELYGLVRAMDRRLGEDRQHYLSLWSSEPIVPSRAEAAAYLPNPVVGIVGGLQPTLVQKIRRKDQDGFLERFLLVFAAGFAYSWEGAEGEGAMGPPEIGPILDLLRTLRTIEGAREIPQGLEVMLSAEARAVWAGWYDGNRDQLLVASLSVHGFYRKMPSHLARLALVLHGLWHPDDPTAPLSGETLRRAIELVEFYRVHVHRAITLIGEREPLRSPEVSLGELIIRNLDSTREPDGWVGRTTLLGLLGRPETVLFNELVDAFVDSGILERRTINAQGKGRPATSYRLAIR